jgi:phosphoglycerol transferase MdoB-like AlkP superfamily enzyme
MDDKTLLALGMLAEKLGTTSEYLWGALLKQAPISGVVDLVVLIAFVVAVWFWAKFVKFKTTPAAPTDECKYPRAEWSEELAAAAWLSVVVAVFIFVCVFAKSLQGIVAAFFNPEFWALKQILR